MLNPYGSLQAKPASHAVHAVCEPTEYEPERGKYLSHKTVEVSFGHNIFSSECRLLKVIITTQFLGG